MANNFLKLLLDYDKHCLRIKQATSINIHETVAEKNARIKKTEKDYITWFEYFFPNYAKKKSAWFHVKLAKKVIENKKNKTLAEWFRSAAKSVHIDMGIPLFLYLVKNDLRFMLLIGETDPKAKKLLSSIQAQLQYNQRIINDYGKKFQYGDWSDGDFSTVDGVRFMSLGFLQSPRGAQEQGDRPDYIVIDDVDSKKHINSDRIMRESVDYITEDVWGCFDSEDDAVERFVYANNNFHKNSITNRLKLFFLSKIKEAKENKVETDYYILRVDAVKNLKDFEPNWPEKTTAQYWKKKYNSMPFRSFMREFMNTHIEEGKVFKPNQIQFTKILPYEQYDAIVFYGDLSFKDKACHKSIVGIGKIGRNYHILHILFGQVSRVAAAEWLYDLYEDYHLDQCDNIRFIIEGLFAMDEFVNDFDDVGDERGYYIPVVASKRIKGDKFDRIESMTSHYERMRVFYNEKEKDNADTILARDTLLAFEKGADIPLDYLDAQEGGMAELNAVTFRSKFDIVTTSRDSMRHRYY